MDNLRIGNGYDVHRFDSDSDLILGGIKIPFEFGLKGHSDADVLTHAIIDSLLGAASMGDIGQLFPDNDEKFKNISSILLLKDVKGRLDNEGISIINIDTVVICEFPKISPYIEKIKSSLSLALNNIEHKRISIKGKTTEGLGFTGRNEGIAVYSIALIKLFAPKSRSKNNKNSI